MSLKRRWSPFPLALGTGSFIIMSLLRAGCFAGGDSPEAVARKVVQHEYGGKLSFPERPEVTEEAPRLGYSQFRVAGMFRNQETGGTGEYSMLLRKLDRAEVNRYHPEQRGRRWQVVTGEINGERVTGAWQQLW